MPQFLNARELAEQTGIDYAKILKLARRGRIPCIRDSQHRVLINLDLFMKALRPDLEIGPDLKGRPSRTPHVTPLTRADLEGDLEAIEPKTADAQEVAPPPRSTRARSRSRTAARS